MNNEGFDVLIVGTGHAGAQAAIMLRQLGFLGSIGMIGEERDLPYERPPLSKEYLAKDKSLERILLRPASFWKERDITLMLGRRIGRLDPDKKFVFDEQGIGVGYGDLVWATGGHARKLACDGRALRGVHTIRTRADVDRLTEELPDVRRVVVVGGGYIGLEAAAAMIKAGKQVTVLEASDRVLARVAGEPLSRFYEKEHRARGVDLRLNQHVVSLAGQDRVSAVRLETGEEIECEMVIVGIGIVPMVEPLQAAGAAVDNGVEIDEYCRTTLPNVYAVGDCASHHNVFADGGPIRLESVQNANDQGTVAAKAIVGQPERYSAVPWFWSMQYDIKLQTIGVSRGYDKMVLRGEENDRSFSIVYLKEGKVIALDCVNSVKDFVQGRRLVVEGVHPDRAIIGCASVPLKDIAA